MTWHDLRPVVAKPRQIANTALGASYASHGRPWPGQGRLAIDLFVCWVVVDTFFRTESCVFRAGIRRALRRPWQGGWREAVRAACLAGRNCGVLTVQVARCRVRSLLFSREFQEIPEELTCSSFVL